MNTKEIFDEAVRAGRIAGETAKVNSVTLCEFSLKRPENVKRWVLNDGLCGFAGVRVRPANCAMANLLKRMGGYRSYENGGVYFPIHDFGQSYVRKTACAEAFASVLRKYGIDAWAESRLD